MSKTKNTMPKIRNMNFQFDENTPPHWFKDNPFLTHMVNSFHIVFPEGEKFFIRSVKAFTDQTDSEILKKRIKLFIGQENLHAHEHEKFWLVMKSQGLPVDEFHKFYAFTSNNIISPIVQRLIGPKISLANTVALEHYTAVLASVAFEVDLEKVMPKELASLLLWHACEEIEHKAVAFDLLKEVDDSYALRIAGMAMGSFFLVAYATLGQAMFLAADKNIELHKLPGQFLDYLKFTAKPLASIIRDTLDYLRVDFHPDDNDNNYLAEDYFASLEKVS